MNKAIPILSRSMLILGGLMIVAGLGWSIWLRIHRPPAPVITEAGAVVLAETAAPRSTSLPPAATQVPLPTSSVAIPSVTKWPNAGPTPAMLPDWGVTPEPTRTRPIAILHPTPTPTGLPPAQEPPTRIAAPAIKLDAPVVPMSWEMVDSNGTLVSRWLVPANAAGWHMNSALPGQGENVVLSGHHNIEGKVFRYVVDLEPGDEITLYAGGIPYRYIVTEKYILKEAGMPQSARQKNAQWIMPSGDERLTLVTCWPYEWPGNTHRVIVVARPPDYAMSMFEESVGGKSR
jgi:sortase A